MLVSAIELDLFTVLGERRLTAEEIRAELGLSARAVPDFTDALVALNLLYREGDGPDAKYYNTPDSAQFLSKASSLYVGGLIGTSIDHTQSYVTPCFLPAAFRSFSIFQAYFSMRCTHENVLAVSQWSGIVPCSVRVPRRSFVAAAS